MEGLDKTAHTPSKRKTRAAVAEEEIVRRISRERQQKRRANMSSRKKRRENEKAKQRYHTRKQKLLQERVQSTGPQIDGKKSRAPDKISKAFKDFLVGSKLKRDKLSIVKRNAMMCTIVKITGRYQATKQIGLR